MYDYEEDRELIQIESDNNPEFLKYCYCTRLLWDSAECSCKYISLSTCASPFVILADAFSFVPQLIINNIKLCFI